MPPRLLLLLAVLLTATSAGAQQSEPRDAREVGPTGSDGSVQRVPPADDDVEEISVIGQRTGGDAQSQAIAITAFSQEELDQLGITRLSDLQANIPSLHISQTGTVTIVTLRGVGIENINISGEPGVIFIVDGIPIADIGAIDGAFFDVVSVQAQRGPQGTQGHKNAPGGWIEVRSAPPHPDLTAEADYQYGTHDQHVWRWALNVPVHREKLMTRVSGRFEDRDGYQRAISFFDPINVLDFRPIPANRSDDFNSAHDLDTRFQLRSLPGRGIDLRAIGTYGFRRGNAPAPHLLGDPGNSSLRSGPFEPRFPGLRARTSDDPNWNRTNVRNPQISRTASATLLATRDFSSPPLGTLRLEGTFGYFRADRELVFDLDATERDAQLLYQQVHSQQYSGELTLETIDARPWDWKLGVFYRQEERLSLGAILTRPIFDRRIFQQIENDSLAGFFEISYWLTERFRLLVGARYSEDHRAVRDLAGPIKIKHPSVLKRTGRRRRPGRTSVNATFDSFTPKFQLQWQWSDASHVSVSATKGAKSGGFPLGTRCTDTLDCPPYDSEQVWQYELTSKNDFLDERLRLNLTLFWTDYDPYQVCWIGGLQTVCNTGGSATSRGVEFELQAYPVPELALNLNFNILDARIDNYRLIDPFQPQFIPGSDPRQPNPFFGFPQDLSGNRMNKAPKYNLSVGLQYDLALRLFGRANAGTLTPRVQYQYQTRTYYRPWNREEFSQPRFSKVDLRLAWRSPSNRWSIEGFVNNVSDVDVINYLQVGAIGDGTVFGYYQTPRSAGARFAFRY